MPRADTAANERVNSSLGQSRPLVDFDIRSPADLDALRAIWASTEAAPVIRSSREEGSDHSWGDIDLRTYLGGEHSAGTLSVHNIVLKPGSGLPPHYHADTETFLIVVEGEPVLQIGALSERAAKYSVGYAPARTRVGFANTSNRSAMLMLVYKSAGLERAFTECHALWLNDSTADESLYCEILEKYGVAFDNSVLDNDSRTNCHSEPVLHEIKREGDLEALRSKLFERRAIPTLTHTSEAEVAIDGHDPGFRKRILNGDTSAGSAMINFVSRIPPAPNHYQPTEEELFFILDGELRMTCGNGSAVLGQNGFAFAPRHCTHGFGPPSPNVDHKFMTLNSPAGHEHAMAALREKQKRGLTDQEFREFSAIGGFIIH